MSNFNQLYCEKCKLIYGRKSTGLLLNCTQCGEKLGLKSFNPWPKIIGDREWEPGLYFLLQS